MLPLKILLCLMVALSFVIADDRVGEIAEDPSYYQSSQNPDRSQLPRVIQPIQRIPRPMPRPIFVATVEPEPAPTIAEGPYPVAGNQPDSRPNFSFSRPSQGSRPITYPSSRPSVPLPENSSNRPSIYVPNRPLAGWPARQPVPQPTTSVPPNVVDQAPSEKQKEVSDSWSSSLGYRPILSARPIPTPFTAGVIESTPPVTEPVSIPEPDTPEMVTENIVEEQKEVGITPRPVPEIPTVIPADSKPSYQRPTFSARPTPRPFTYGTITPKIELPPITEPSTEQAHTNKPKTTEVPNSNSLPEEPEIQPEILTIPISPAIISPVTAGYVTLPAIPAVWRPYQRPIISARPVPRPTFNGIITTPQPTPQETKPIEPLTSPSSIITEHIPTTEVVPLPSSRPEPIEPLPNSTPTSINTYIPKDTIIPATPPIPEAIPEPVITEEVLSSTAFPEVSISPESLVIIPHHMPSPGPVSRPRPNIEYWSPNPNPSVPVQPLPVQKPLVPTYGRYPPAQVQPNNNIVSNVVAESKPTLVTNRPTSKPILGNKPIPNTSPTVSVIPGNVLDMRCESENGYFARQECDSYVECKRNVATEYLCPDGLHFNPNTVWPEYPCAYPSEVQCIGRPVNQQANPTSECPRQYGFFSMGGDCSKYLMCQEGLATIMSCPPGLVYNPAISGCDWPEQVPSCKLEVFQGFSCPPVPSDEDPDIIIKYKYGNSCKNYVACQRGSPRLLSCDDGFSFDTYSGYCIESNYVENCAGFV